MTSQPPVGTWAKSTSTGSNFTITLHSDGSLTECHRDAPHENWSGTWQTLSPDHVEVTIGPYQAVLTRSTGDSWAGPEFCNGEPNCDVVLRPSPSTSGGAVHDAAERELRSFVRSVLEQQKHFSTIDDNIAEQLVEDLAGRLENRILRAMIEELDEQQLTVFEGLIDSGKVTDLETYFIDAGVPVQEIVTREFAKFASEYA